MGAFSIWHVALVVVVLLVLFGGRGKISGIMGDTAKGIKAFREGLKGDDKGDDKSDADAKKAALPKDEKDAAA